MQPDQPAPNTPQGQYDFIFNNNTPVKPASKLGLPGGDSKLKRIIVVAVGVIFLFIIGSILLSLLSSGSKGYNEKVVGLVQEQTEIIRVAELARKSNTVRDSNTLNLATNASVSMTSSKKELVAILAKNKRVVKDKELKAKANSKTDLTLETASKNNTFDAVFNELFNKMLIKYQTNVKEVYNETKNKANKKALESSYNGIVTLLPKKS